MCRTVPPLLFLLATSLCGAQPPAPPGQRSASTQVITAVADLRTLPLESRRYQRYLDLSTILAADRPELIQTLSGHVNGLNRRVDRKPLHVVPAAQGTLLRLDLRWYGWPESVWEQLADADPFYQLPLDGFDEVSWPGGTWKDDGLPYDAGAFRWKRPKRALAPWLSEGPLGKERLAELASMTGSRIPIVRGDFFLWQTIIQEGRSPGYYDFLGIKNQKDYESLVRFNAKTAEDLEHLRPALFSGITVNRVRRIERDATVKGGLWRTKDSDIATGKFNPLRVLKKGDLAFKATRQIAPLPCGMPGFLLATDKGVRQNQAPPDIVGGVKYRPGNDTRLHIGMDCLGCHLSGKNENMLKDWPEVKFIKLAAVEYETLLELQRQYTRKLAPEMRRDREGYAEAIFESTGGMTGQEFGTAVGKWYSYIEDAKYDLERIAQEVCCTEATLLAGLKAVDRTGNLDPVLSVIMNGGAIPYAMYAEVYPLAQFAARGLVVPQNYRSPKR